MANLRSGEGTLAGGRRTKGDVPLGKAAKTRACKVFTLGVVGGEGLIAMKSTKGTGGYYKIAGQDRV